MSVIISIYFVLVSSVYLEQQLDSVMTLGWDIDTLSREILITLKCQITYGYCSIGLTRSMTNTDMFAALTDSTSVTVEDYWSINLDTPRTDRQQGGTTDYFLVSSNLTSTGLTAVIRRKLDTGDKYDQAIVPDIFSQICWAYRNSGNSGSNNGKNREKWSKHSYYNEAAIVWATSKKTFYYKSSTQNKALHGAIMSFAWAGTASLGIGAARYFKDRFWWFYVHFFFLMFSSLSTVISVYYINADDSYSFTNQPSDSFYHSRIGSGLGSLVIAQVLFGLLTSYSKIFTKNTQLTLLLTHAHKCIGYAMFIAGLINCWKGWALWLGPGQVLIAAAFVIIFIAFVILECLQRFRWNKVESHAGNLPEITHFKAMEMIKEGKQLMFSDDVVIDVSKFANSHPGGSYMVSESLGEDAGKYMVGCSSFGSTLNPYAHSDKAFSMLGALAIGQIPYPEGYLLPLAGSNPVFKEFSLREKEKINDHTYLMYLKSEQFTMSSTINSPTWLGKHFMLMYKTRYGKVRRYYSSLFVDIKEWAHQLGITDQPESTLEAGSVKFIFKVYNEGKMTQHLHKLVQGDKIYLKGPIGPGLMLRELNGRYMAIAGGTGLVPFLDLVYLAWKTFGPSCEFFNLHLYVFFRTWKDGFALDILEDISMKCKWLNLQIVTDQKIDKAVVNKDIESKAKEMDLIWICGPSGFNRSYYSLAEGSGINKAKIILM